MKNLINYLKALWSRVADSQSKDVRHDCRLTVGSPSGLDTKWKQNPFMRFAVVLTLIFTIGVGNVWGALSSPYTCTFTAGMTMSGSNCTTGDVTWTISTTTGKGSPTIEFGNQNSQSCIKLGSGKNNYYSKMTLTTSAFSSYNVTSVVIYASSNNGGSKTFKVTQGATQIGTGSQSFSSTTWVTNITRNTNPGSGGDLSIEISSDATATFIHSIKVTYTAAASGHSITYECNGATSGCPSNASGQTALPNPLPTPSKTNYTFGGWYTNEGLTTPATAGATLSGNVTLYAKWTCSAKLTVNLNTPTHGTYVVHQGNNASGPVVSDGDVLDNCSSQSLYIVFSPEDGYGVTGFTVTGNGVQDPATAYITDHVRCDYSAGTKTTDITVTFGKACATPTISFPTAAITKYWGDGKFTFAPTITGNDLEAELTFSSNKESCATVNSNTGEVTIVNATGSGSPVTITATLAAATDGDDCQREVSASYTLTIYNKVTWLIDGEPAPAGSQTTIVNEGGKVTVFPTDPDGDAVCSGKTFVGWTTSTYTGDAAPTPLYTSVSDMSSVYINDNLTLHAVFAEGSGGGGGSSGSEELTKSEITTNVTNTTCAYGTEKTYSDGDVDYAFSVYTDVASRPWVQMKKADAASYIEISAPGNISQVDLIITTATNSSGGVTDISKHDKLPAGTTLNLNTMKSTNTTNRVAYVSGDGSSTSLSIVVSSPSNSTLYLQPTGGACRIWGITVHYGSGGGSYTDYSTTCGNCLAAPEPVVTARTDNAIISWATVEGATGYNVTCSGGSVSVSGTTATITGLTSETSYTYTIQSVGPNPPYDCFPVKNGSFTTPGATIDIVEWKEDAAVIYVDKEEGINPLVIIDGEVEHGSISGSIATDLFFSKYFEGYGSIKLVAIYNGTGKDIPLANYSLYTKNCPAPESESEIASSSFTGITTYPINTLGTIKAGQEIILFSRPLASESAVYSCSNDYLDAKVAQSGADANPRWIECNDGTFPTMKFNGNDAICLEKNSSLIDVIGSIGDPGKEKNCSGRLNDLGWSINVKNIDYGKSPSDKAYKKLFDESSLLPVSTDDSISILSGFNVNLSSEYIDLTTARCILFRDKNVTSGECAVALNTGATFATCNDFICSGNSYKSEWNGRLVCMSNADKVKAGVDSDGEATCNSYQDLGKFDYNDYYTTYDNISKDTYLDSYSHNSETGEYTIPIDNLSQYSCLSLRFQLKQGETVLTENAVQVPIIVKGSKTTADAIFNEIVEDKETHEIQYDKSIERCQTCNVVVLGDATLTKATDGATHDVPQIKDLTVYPGGKLVVPSSTNYTVRSLALRRQEDAVSMADIKGNLSIGTTNGVSLDLRIDPTNWHYITLPYDCNVDDVTFSDGEPAELGTDYLIAWYDGAYRAANKDGGWTDVTAGTTLKKGLGYIVSLPGAGKVRKELRFPMANGVIAAEKADKTVSYVYAYGGNQSDENLRPNHKGWNLVGNPYMMYYETDITSPLKLGTLERDPEDPKLWVLNTTGAKNVRYLVEPISNGWSGYKQIAIGTHMPPFTSYFVQVGGTDAVSNNPATDRSIEFHVAKSGLSSIRRRAPEEIDVNHPIWYGIEMIAPNAEKDQTTLLISDNFTDDYDMMDDLVKMRGSYYKYYNLPVLASRNAKDELAFNALPDESAAVNGVPLNYYAAQAGTYTIRTDSRYDLEEVKSAMLHDAVANTWTDLLENNYEFYSDKGDNTNRFMLYVRVERKKAPEVATGCDNLLDGQLSLIAIDRTLVLSGLTEDADIYVYDMSGKLLRGERANGNGIWRATVPSQGVYFVRVNGISGQQTLRTIVK